MDSRIEKTSCTFIHSSSPPPITSFQQTEYFNDFDELGSPREITTTGSDDSIAQLHDSNPSFNEHDLEVDNYLTSQFNKIEKKIQFSSDSPPPLNCVSHDRLSPLNCESIIPVPLEVVKSTENLTTMTSPEVVSLESCNYSTNSLIYTGNSELIKPKEKWKIVNSDEQNGSNYRSYNYECVKSDEQDNSKNESDEYVESNEQHNFDFKSGNGEYFMKSDNIILCDNKHSLHKEDCVINQSLSPSPDCECDIDNDSGSNFGDFILNESKLGDSAVTDAFQVTEQSNDFILNKNDIAVLESDSEITESKCTSKENLEFFHQKCFEDSLSVNSLQTNEVDKSVIHQSTTVSEHSKQDSTNLTNVVLKNEIPSDLSQNVPEFSKNLPESELNPIISESDDEFGDFTSTRAIDSNLSADFSSDFNRSLDSNEIYLRENNFEYHLAPLNDLNKIESNTDEVESKILRSKLESVSFDNLKLQETKQTNIVEAAEESKESGNANLKNFTQGGIENIYNSKIQRKTEIETRTKINPEIIDLDEDNDFGDFEEFKDHSDKSDFKLEFSDEEESDTLSKLNDEQQKNLNRKLSRKSSDKFKGQIAKWFRNAHETVHQFELGVSNLLLNSMIASNKMWMLLSDVESSAALKIQNENSKIHQFFLSYLDVDSRNIMCNEKYNNSSIPIFAQTLGFMPLTPAKPIQRHSQPKSNSNDSDKPSQHINEKIIPPVQFDWNTSGLINPLRDASLASNSSEEPKTIISPILEKILNERTATSTVKKHETDLTTLTPRAKNFINKLPNLNFMRSKMLVFPSLNEDENLL